ncbi:MAG: hypothetical protein ACLUOS_05825 [Odoribacter splanchnicus]
MEGAGFTVTMPFRGTVVPAFRTLILTNCIGSRVLASITFPRITPASTGNDSVGSAWSFTP